MRTSITLLASSHIRGEMKSFQFGEAVPGNLRQVLVAPQTSALKAVVSATPQSLSQLYLHLIFSTEHREPRLLLPVDRMC